MANDSITDNKLEAKNMPWASALDGAMTMSSWLIGPLVVGFLVGNYFDKKYLTGGHKYLYISLGLAFLITLIGLVSEVMKFIKWSAHADTTKVASLTAEALDDESTNVKTTEKDESSSIKYLDKNQNK